MNNLADLIDRRSAALEQSIFTQGIVTENENEDFPGQVKVEFTAYKSGRSICRWMPILQGYAGKDYGVYCIPEVGDKVLVSFLGADRDTPFVIGSFFPGDNSFLKAGQKEKNAIKQFKSKGGLTAALDDTDKKQSFTLTTPKGITIKAEDENETAAISDANGETAISLDMKNGAVTISAKQTITIKSGKCEIKLDGQSGAIAISCDRIDIKASQQAKLSSDQMLSLSANMLQAEGKQTAQIKGGSMLELSGGIAKIN